MGFEVPEHTLKLIFSDPSYQGLEVRCRLATIDQVTAAAKLSLLDVTAMTAENASRLERALDDFADALISWDLEKKGRKVPATRKGVGSQDPLFVLQLIEAWLSGSGKLLASQLPGQSGVEEADLPVEPI